MTESALHLIKTIEDLAALETAERSRQLQARIDALAVDRSRFESPALQQIAARMATECAEEEAAWRRKRDASPLTKLQALQRLLAPAPWWRRIGGAR